MKFETMENVKRIKSFYDALAHGDVASARHVLDMNIEWIEPKAPGIWFSGTHRGAEAVFEEVLQPAGEEKDEDGVVQSSRQLRICRKCGNRVIDKWSDHGGRTFEKVSA